MNALSTLESSLRSRGRWHICWLLLTAGLVQAGELPVESSSSKLEAPGATVNQPAPSAPSPAPNVPASLPASSSAAPLQMPAGASATQPVEPGRDDKEKLPGQPPAMPRQPEAPVEPPGAHSPPADLGLPAIHFAAASSSLTVDAQAILDVVAQIFLDAQKSGMIRIEGRSDGVESSPGGDTSDGRLSLSRARAETVRDYLVSRGVPSARLIVVGRGDGAPVGELETPKDRERNRVVSFYAMNSSGSSMVRELSSNNAPPDPASTSGNAGSAGGGSANPAAIAPAADTSPPQIPGPGQPSGPTPSPSSFPAGSRPSTARDLEAVSVQATPQIPSEVEDIRLGLKIVRRDGPGAATRSPWQSQEFLQQELAEFEKLYRSQLRLNRRLVGDTRIQIWLNAEGDVRAASVGLPSQDTAFELKLISFLKTWDAPPPPAKDEMRVEMVLTITATFRPILVTPR